MITIRARNVCEALAQGLEMIRAYGRREDSRAGPVLVAPCPVMTVYLHPRERVLASPARDANPFFHLFEALWMLAGRRDSEFLNRFVRDFGERFAEPGGEIHDAYGHRWRTALGFDQLDAVVEMLRHNPTSRQAVIQMWDARNDVVLGFGERPDELIGSDDLRGSWRGRPCNTHIYLRVRSESRSVVPRTGFTADAYTMASPVLDLTVCCRSNDIIWGAYGANAVHFSVLQEYLAARLGVGVGILYQLSNNWHAYVSELERVKAHGGPIDVNPYVGGVEAVRPEPLVDNPATFDRNVEDILTWIDGDRRRPLVDNTFLGGTVMPMWDALREWRVGSRFTAVKIANDISAPDWRRAAVEWMTRRL